MNQSDQEEAFDAICTTDIMESDKYKFAWEISSFNSRPEKNGKDLISKEFTITGPGDKSSKWLVQLYPKGKNGGDENYISVFLHNLSNEDIDAKYILSTLDANKSKKKRMEFKVHRFAKAGSKGVDINSGWGLPKAFKRDEIVLQAPNDSLVLFFEITIIGGSKEAIQFVKSKKEEEENMFLSSNYHGKKLSQDLSSVFDSKELSDVVVTCDDGQFHCHKIILSSRSPVFKAMLEANMKENVTGRIEIKDMKLAVFDDLIRYIYSGEAPNVDSHAEELFSAANLYQLEELKKLCELKLSSSLDVDNCINLLILGESHQAPTLKDAALNFVSKNLQRISDWEQSLISHPNLMAEVLKSVLPQNGNGDKDTVTKGKKRKRQRTL